MGGVGSREVGKGVAKQGLRRLTREGVEEGGTRGAVNAARGSRMSSEAMEAAAKNQFSSEAVEAAARGGAAGARGQPTTVLGSLFKNPVKSGLAAYAGYDLFDDGQINFTPSGGFTETMKGIFDTIPFLKPLILIVILIIIIK